MSRSRQDYVVGRGTFILGIAFVLMGYDDLLMACLVSCMVHCKSCNLLGVALESPQKLNVLRVIKDNAASAGPATSGSTTPVASACAPASLSDVRRQ